MNDRPHIAEHYEGSDLEALSTLKRYRRWIFKMFTPEMRGVTVEFGAGTGNFAELLLPHASRLDLVEPSTNLHQRLNERFSGEAKVTLYLENLEHFVEKCPSDSYDSVVLVNVLEHIEDDAAALAELHRIIRPGGHLLVLVPALQLLFSKLDVLVGHFRRYDLPGLVSVTEKSGFDMVRVRYFDMIGVAPWLIFNRILGFTDFKPGMASFYDRVFVPISKRMERVFRPPFGKNVVMVARKPE